MRWFTTLIAALTAAASAASSDVASLPGYVPFDKRAILGDNAPAVEINLPAPMLQFLSGASAAAEGVDPEVAEMLRLLQLVRILVVPLDGESAGAVASRTSQLADQLAQLDWMPIVRVDEKPQVVNIYTRMAGDKMAGLALMVTDPEQLVFINIVGEMDPAKMGSLMGILPGGEAVSLGLLDDIDDLASDANNEPPSPPAED